MSPSLAGRRVAVTRGPAAGRAEHDALSARLVALGAVVLEAPAIALADPASFAELDAALAALDEVDWIAFASAHAVERTAARAAALGLPPAALARPRLAAVGEATAARLARLVRAPDLVPGEARGEALAAALAPHVAGRRVLVPRAEDGRPELVEGLARAGATVRAAVAYRTVPAGREALAPLLSALGRRELDAVTFASPSAVRAVLDALGPARGALEGVALAAIGPTTADELRARGLEVAAVPTRPSAAGLADALAAALGPRTFDPGGWSPP